MADDDQRHGHIFGVLFIITFITSIAALGLFQPVLDDPVGYITGGGKDNQIYLGALLEFFLIVSGVGTAVALYPIARRQNEALAIGYVASRIMESVFIAGGIIFVLGVVACAMTFRVHTTPPSRSPRSRTGRSSSAQGFSRWGTACSSAT